MRNEREANAAMDHSKPWPLDFWLKEQVKPVAVRNSRANVLRWVIPGIIALWTGLGLLVYCLLIR